MNVNQRPLRRRSPSKPAPARSRLPLRLLILALALLTALALGYLSLCLWAGGEDRVLPGVVCLTEEGEEVDLGGLTQAEALQALRDVYGQRLESCTLAVNTPDGTRHTLEGALLQSDVEGLAQEAAAQMEQVPLLARGLARFLGDGRRELTLGALALSDEGTAQIEALLDTLEAELAVEVTETSYTVGDSAVEVVKGTSGRVLDREAAQEAVTQALLEGAASVSVTCLEVEPQSFSAQTIYDQVYVAPRSVTVASDGSTTPPVIGVSIDLEKSQSAIDGAAAGETVSIPLVRTQPDYSEAAQGGLIYQDKLSECVTSIGGTSARLNNVTLAARKCNGVILYPGDIFDYNDVVGQRTAAAGFQAAPAYVAGQTVDEIGGGICQVSSSIYYCTVYANLKVVTRSNHRYAVGYVPDGLDATVSWGGPEYRFQNNTDYPIKIVAYVSGRTLTVQFYGTNTDGSYVRTERNRLSTTEYTTVYQADSSVPRGSSKVSVTPYTGRKVEVYRCVYNSDGTLRSRTLENVSNYRSRDRVILLNPADMPDNSGGSSGETAQPSPEPSAQPSPAPEPSPTPEPSPSPEPPAEPSPEPAPEEAPSPDPAPTEGGEGDPG